MMNLATYLGYNSNDIRQKPKGLITISQLEIWAFIAETLMTYTFIQLATSGAAKQNSIDSKRDLRTTKEDLMAEIKDTREELLRESEISTKAIVDILKAELQKGKENGNQRNQN